MFFYCVIIFLYKKELTAVGQTIVTLKKKKKKKRAQTFQINNRIINEMKWKLIIFIIIDHDDDHHNHAKNWNFCQNYFSLFREKKFEKFYLEKKKITSNILLS